ncbi:MAG: hypothetical protein AB8F78_18415 [Saprospiraceae bacterium]
MSLIYSRRYNLFVLLSFGLLWSACEKEEIRPESLFKIVEVGDFELLQESIDQLPYQGKDSVTFVDRDENRLTFQIRESFNPSTQVSTEYFNVDFPRDTVIYTYGSQSKDFYLSNDSLNLRFYIDLSVYVYDVQSENLEICDHLEVWFKYDDNRLRTQVLRDVTNERTLLESWWQVEYEDIELLGRGFEDVFYSRFSNPVSFVRFNYELGIISFTDLDNKMWVYEE